MGNSASAPSTPPPPVQRSETNVSALPPPPPTGMPPVPSQMKHEDIQVLMAEAKQSAAQKSNNPGTYEELHKKTRELFPQVFEGGKIVFSKPLSSHFQITHNLQLANPMTSGYRFGATYAGTKQFSPQEAYPIMLGDTDASGNLNANIIHAFTKNTLTRFVAQFQGDKTNTQMVTDYRGSCFTASFTAANPDLLNGSGIFVGHYLHRAASTVDLGAECMVQRGGQVPGGQIAVVSLGARFNGEKRSLAVTLTPAGPAGPQAHLTYCHRINDHLQVGAELETMSGMGEAVASVGYQQEIPSAGVNFKGQALKCFECINLKDKACGTTWIGSDEGWVECEPEATACQKLEYRDSLQGITTGGVVVSRSCWTSPGKEGYAPSECEKMFSSHVCYCTTDKCNGGQLIQPQWVLVAVALLPLLDYMLCFKVVYVVGK